ncbi:MAG: hypothetical protein QW420_07855 [Candidatus Caldarchaeum sp.]
MFTGLRDVVEENRVENLHSMVKVMLTVDVPRLSYAGRSLEDLKKGTVLNVWRWVADVLVARRCAEYVSKQSLANQLLQIEWREKNNPGELQPLQKHFYVELLREGVQDDYVVKKLRDILTMRMMKIVSIAAKRLDGEIVRRMTPEEEALYKAVYRVVDEWLKAIGSGEGGGDGGATS